MFFVLILMPFFMSLLFILVFLMILVPCLVFRVHFLMPFFMYIFAGEIRLFTLLVAI